MFSLLELASRCYGRLACRGVSFQRSLHCLRQALGRHLGRLQMELRDSIPGADDGYLDES